MLCQQVFDILKSNPQDTETKYQKEGKDVKLEVIDNALIAVQGKVCRNRKF